MTSLQELTSQLNGVKRAFELSTPETNACLGLMDDTVNVLDDMRLEVFTHLQATSSYVQFERLSSLVSTMRDLICEIIETLGDLERDFEPIGCAAELLDVLAMHVQLSQNVASLTKRSRPIQEDLNALGTSMANIRTLLSNFRSSTRKVFTRLRNEKS